MFSKLIYGIRIFGNRASYLKQTSLMSSNFSSVNLKPLHDFPIKDLLPEEKILLPYNYIAEVTGKNTRPRLLRAFNHWLQIPEDKLDAIHEISEILHNYLILIDDIEDDSVLRRGVPVAQSIYGVGSSLNVANYVVFIALQKSLILGHEKATSICLEEMINLHRGVGIELYSRDTMKCPTEEDYYKMTVIKNKAIMSLPFRLMQLFASNKKDYNKLLRDYSLYIQIKDDYTDLISEDRLEYKYYCEDVAEGKFPFPIVHAINQEKDEKLISLLRKKPQDMELKKFTMSVLQRHGSFEYTLDALKRFDRILRDEIASLGGNPKFIELLDDYSYLFE